MKKVLFALVAMSLTFSACEDGADEKNKLDDYIVLEEVNDVCSIMDDLKLMEYCYEEFDVNKDGKVSMSEAAAVTEIDVEVDRSIKGLEYFQNLTDLRIIFCENNDMDLDFSPFKNLKSLFCASYKTLKSDPVKINLSNHKVLEKLGIYSFTLSCLDLRKYTQLKELYTDVSNLDLSNCNQLEKLIYYIRGSHNNPTCLNVKNNLSLKEVQIYNDDTNLTDNGYMSDLDFSQHRKLTDIRVDQVLINTLNLANGKNINVEIGHSDHFLEKAHDDFNKMIILKKPRQTLNIKAKCYRSGDDYWMDANIIYGKWSFTVQNVN